MRSNSFIDTYLFDNLFKPKSLSFLVIKNRLKTFIRESEDTLWGFLISKYFRVIFTSLLFNNSFKSNNSARASVVFSCGCLIPYL